MSSKAGYLLTALPSAGLHTVMLRHGRACMLMVLQTKVQLLCAAHVAFTLAMETMPTSHRVVMMVVVQGFWTIGTVFEVGSLMQGHTTLQCCRPALQ